MVFNKIDQESANSITSALDFFTIPPTNTSVSSSTWREYLTLNPVTDIPYRFRIYSSNNYLDLSKVYLLTEAKILKRNADNDAWIPIVAGDAVGTINYIGNTFIKYIKVTLNGREITDSNSLYMYKAYLDAELSLPVTAKESYLSVAGYYTDDDQDTVANPGFLKRGTLFRTGKTAQFISRLDVDLFNQPNYMISGVEIEIEIMPNDSNFCILEPANTATVYKFEITSLRLFAKSLDLMSGLAYDISQKLEKAPARYAIRRTSVKSHFITENRTEFSAMLWSEQVPRRVILGLISNNRYIGAKNLSPFKFEPFNVREMTVFANGKSYPPNLYNLNYTDGLCSRAYHDLQEALGFASSTESNGISLEKFKSGWTLYSFNLTNSGEQNPCFDLISEGATNINIKFNNPVPGGGIVLIALAEFDSLIYIDRLRNVLSDYNA